MIGLMLRFESEPEAREVLSQFLFEGEWALASHAHALDPIGPIDGDGFHINLQLATYDGASLEAWRVYPASPKRVWA